MENVFDIKYKQNLEYILPTVIYDDASFGESAFMEQVAVIMYFYYIDTVANYCAYIDKIQHAVKVYVVTPLDAVAQKVSDEIVDRKWLNVEIIMKPNRGRDVSGLLIATKSVIGKYKYICFIHDKKSHFKETEEDVALWIENMWENLIGNVRHIRNIVDIFEENEQLGVLSCPAPIGKVFKVWYGYGWRDCFETTKDLAIRLNLKCDLDETKPPITIGTTFWFRWEALQKLFDYPWTYEDFDDDQLKNNNYLSYAVERIFAYVAQDAGFNTGEVMTVDYARKQTLFLQYSMAEIFRKLHPFYPFPTYENALCMDDNLQHLLQYASEKEKVLLYGIGDAGKFCVGYLRKFGYEPECFLVSDYVDEKMVDNIPVYSIDEYSEKLLDKGIVITATSKNVQKEMIDKLKEYKIEDYCVFLQEAR